MESGNITQHLPGKDETENLYERHFYDPTTGLNYRNNSNCARYWFFTHYQNAISAFNAGNYTQAWERLGRAIHYLGDMNTPHHAANLPAPGSNHVAFEEQIDHNRTRYSATSAGTKYNTAITSLPVICAQNAKNHLSDATSIDDLTTYEPWLRAGDNTVPFAMQYTAVVLYHFHQAVTA